MVSGITVAPPVPSYSKPALNLRIHTHISAVAVAAAFMSMILRRLFPTNIICMRSRHHFMIITIKCITMGIISCRSSSRSSHHTRRIQRITRRRRRRLHRNCMIIAAVMSCRIIYRVFPIIDPSRHCDVSITIKQITKNDCRGQYMICFSPPATLTTTTTAISMKTTVTTTTTIHYECRMRRLLTTLHRLRWWYHTRMANNRDCRVWTVRCRRLRVIVCAISIAPLYPTRRNPLLPHSLRCRTIFKSRENGRRQQQQHCRHHHHHTRLHRHHRISMCRSHRRQWRLRTHRFRCL
mmetsp:Transcript_40440/g.66416  ORF Transcript_40440/g.66416 Transcript_40440/m.66416 type:complete len:294 (-) Transcript_40440:266-1147(-)